MSYWVAAIEAEREVVTRNGVLWRNGKCGEGR